MEKHPIENLMDTAMQNIKNIIDVDTVIGEPINISNETTIIPISKVSLGFAAGGSEFKNEVQKKKSKKEDIEDIEYKNPFGGGSGAGMSIKPIGFLVTNPNKSSSTRFLPVDNISTIDRIIDYIPNLLEKIFKQEKEEKKQNEIVENNVINNDIKEEYFSKDIPAESDGEDF